MALKKHEFPILERDTEQKAVIMPNRRGLYKLLKKCVYAFLEDTTEIYASKNKCEKIAEFVSITKTYPIYRTIFRGDEICFCQAPCGAPAATQILDFLFSYGVEFVISCGSCGALHEFDENQIIIPTSALRDEGTSYHYIEPSRYIEINEQAISAIKKAADINNIRYEECRTWTTDGFYRETKDMVRYRIDERCAVVEMECSALSACAQFRKAIFGQILFTADSLTDVDLHDEREWGRSSYEIALNLSFEAVYYIDKL